MKRLLKYLLSFLLAGCSLPTEVTFRSLESRTIGDQPVVNQIRFARVGARDVWMMNQSHDGGSNFDRLAIVVENQRAEFFQLAPGPLVWSDDLRTQQREYQVSCALCHANGPRAIRVEGNVTLRERAQVAWWNLKIKMYPRVVSEAAAGFDHKVPFAYTGAFANSPLRVATCAFCHREDGPIRRGTLLRQNSLTIASMVDRGEMPPFGLPLPASERRELDRFLKGF